MALHNLSCAYWWDYKETVKNEREKAMKEVENDFQSVNENPLNDPEFLETIQKIEKRNKTIVPNLKNAIKSFERRIFPP